MSLLNTLRIPTLALAALGLGAGLSGSANALSIDCAGAGCLVGVYTLHLGNSGPDRAGPSDAPLGSLLTGRLCSGNSRAFQCLDLEQGPERGNARSWQVRLGTTRIFDDLRGEPQYALPTRPRGGVLPGRGTANPIPEPSAALIFGIGMLVASGLVKRTGSLE